ncbi:MAG: NAD-dependent epimerase/dehydratase family protein [Promethearchaeota archaeon]
MKKALITGSSGLIGSAICEKFAQEGWEVLGVDKYLRSYFLQSKEAETNGQIQQLQELYPNIIQYDYDIKDLDNMSKLIKDTDAIIHCAAQVSHPRSLEIPIEDAQTNIMGTLNLLELTRQYNPEIPFAFISSNKVYGDYPNYFNYQIIDNDVYKRYENSVYDSFDESLPLDRCGHTPFGVSKAAADLYTQEYAVNYGMKTATFRGGCLIGKNQKAVEVHGFLGFFTKQILLKNKIMIYGGGYRVRDNIHSSDVAEVIYLWVNKPKKNQIGNYGTPYNLGGLRQNSVSIFETLNAIEAKTGIKPIYEDAPARESDHIWWISDMSKFKKDYPEWKGITKDLDYIFNELILHWIKVYDLDVQIKEKDYFKRLRKEL